MKKQVLLAVLMLLPVLAWADDYTYDGVTYDLDDTSSPIHAEVKKITKTGDVVIPSYVGKGTKSYKVTRFRYNCGNSGMTSISIPNTVDRFHEDAFNGCTGLTAVKITDLAQWCKIYVCLCGYGSDTDSYSSNPLRLAHNLYVNNALLTNLDLSAFTAITNLGAGVFEGASCLTSVTLPWNLKSIGRCTFQECTGLTSLAIPNNVTGIDWYAFRNCTSLQRVTLGSGLTSIGAAAFYGCDRLRSVVCNAATPPSINGNAFSDNTLNYGTLAVPKGKKDVYAQADGWSKFKNIVEVGDPGYEFEYGGYYYRVLDTSTSIYTCEMVKTNGSTNIVVSSSAYDSTTGRSYTVTQIGLGALSDVKSTMTSITIPSTVKRIKEDVFYNCKALTRVNINDMAAFCNMDVEDAMTAFDNHPTYYAHHLYLNNAEVINLSIPSSVTDIKLGTFAGCSSIKTVTFPASLKSIGYTAFTGCSGLTELNIPNSVETISHGAFSGCTSLNKVSFGSGLTTIYDYAFNGCTNIQTIELAGSTPPTLVDVEKTGTGSHAFDSSILSSATVIVPKGALNNYRANTEWNRFTNIAELWGQGYTFEYNFINFRIIENNNVEVAPRTAGYTGSIYLPQSFWMNNTYFTVTGIGMNAFANCTTLNTISLPPTLTLIKEGAFKNCTGLTAVQITDLAAFCKIKVEDNMTAVDNHPTYYAHHLYLNGQEIRDLVIPNDNSVTKIQYGTFAGLTSLTSVTIPDRVTSIEASAFAGCTSLQRVTIPSSVTQIQSGAFQVCSNLSTIISLRGTAPSCVSDAFRNVPTNSCVLWVPRGCKGNYKNTDPWSSFLYTNELIMGDANVDGVVNAADVVEAVNAKKGSPSIRFIQYNVDQTGNGIDASDINAVVNKVMGK